MTRQTVIYLLLALFLLNQFGAVAQIEEQNSAYSDIDVTFAKDDLIQKTDELSFNVINITNNSDSPLPIKPRLSVPKGFAVFSAAFVDTIIQPHSTIRLPYRLRISSDAAGDIEHQVVFRAFTDKNQLFIEKTSVVQPEAYHDWDIELPKDRVFFYPRYNLAEFQVVLKNNGNVGELINLDITPDRKISFSEDMPEDWNANQMIYLGPKTDSVVSFKVTYNYSKEKIFDVSKVNIVAETKDRRVQKSAFIEKYNDEYSPLIVDNTLPHITEAGIRSREAANKNLIEPFVNARGVSDYKNGNSFRYYYSNFRLNETDDFIRNSNYRFEYSMKNGLTMGLGSFGSQLGRNLYSRNSLMVDYKNDLSPQHKIEGFASQDILDPKTSGAVSHWYDNGKYNIQTTASYSLNKLNKINTATFSLTTKEFPIYKQNYVTAVLYGLREDYNYANKYHQQGLAYDLNYTGNYGTRFRLQLFNNYGTPGIPGNQMGLFNVGSLLTFFPKDLMTHFTVRYNYFSRNFYYRDFYGEQLPTNYLKDQYVSVKFHNQRNVNFIWSIGPSGEIYHARRPELTNYAYTDYDIKKMDIEINTYFWRSLRVELEAGFRKIFYDGPQKQDGTKFDFHVDANYGKNGYGVRAKYDYGPLVNKGLYQRPADVDYNGLNIGPYIVKGYFRNRIVLQLYTSLLYRFDLHYLYTNISPNIETYVYRNWYVKAAGNYTYFRQDNPEFKSENSNYFVELSVVKKWGNTEYYRKQRQLRRLKVICFKDENGNGRKDKYEEGIPNVKTRLQLIREDIQPAHESFPIDISLLTNEKGYVIFNQIPKGFYNIDVVPLTDMREYFYVSRTHEKVDLLENTTFYIPFQKASKIEGRLDIERSKFSTRGPIDLKNIKITAYNKSGNSFSSFTREDGSFTIYVPGDTTYLLRMENVFGSNFSILQNDIPKLVPDPKEEPVIFNIVEKSRQISFKKAETPQVGGPQKTKILKGKIYENSSRKPVDPDALPDFDMKGGKSAEHDIESGKYYIVLNQGLSREEAEAYIPIVKEFGVDAYFGYDENTDTHYVFTKAYDTRQEALEQLRLIKGKGIKDASIMVFK